MVHRVGESEINYIKIFQNAQALEVSVGGSYSEDRLYIPFWIISRKRSKYLVQIASHKSTFRRELKTVDQISLSLFALEFH